ncbi:MAG: hypothetical protein COA78_10150 [Blastopirellula sp.]|nr:MAG: hypothetical protein COA78_10150 [Blastopirellula sp.]
MKLTSKKMSRGADTELQMTSMIDVIFLLMIFFLVTASFTTSESELETATKVNEKTSSSQPSDLEPAIIEVKQGDGRFVYMLGSNQYNTHAELQAVLEQFPNKSDGAFVRASDAAPYGMAAAAIQAAKSSGFQVVSYVPLIEN